MNEAEAKAQVNALLAEMEVAAEEDHAAFDEGAGLGPVCVLSHRSPALLCPARPALPYPP